MSPGRVKREEQLPLILSSRRAKSVVEGFNFCVTHLITMLLPTAGYIRPSTRDSSHRYEKTSRTAGPGLRYVCSGMVRDRPEKKGIPIKVPLHENGTHNVT